MAAPELVVALDVASRDEALRLRDELEGLVGWLKIGSELFTAAGPTIVRELAAAGASVFLDLKFHDIPRTVAAAVRAASRLGARIVDVHALGGRPMLEAAVAAARESSPAPAVFAVTVLTHLDGADLDDVGIAGPPEAAAARLARLAASCGLDGVVASAHEVETIRAATADRLDVLVPGVRPAWAPARHDQKRVARPAAAARAGARYVVVGRAIVGDPRPRDAAARILDELEGAAAAGGGA